MATSSAADADRISGGPDIAHVMGPFERRCRRRKATELLDESAGLTNDEREHLYPPRDSSCYRGKKRDAPRAVPFKHSTVQVAEREQLVFWGHEPLCVAGTWRLTATGN